MQTIIKEIQVFKFDELSVEAKERARQDYCEIEDYSFLIEEELKQTDECFDEVKLQYSLSYCQGDGLSFSGELNLRKFLTLVYSKKRKLNKKMIDLLCDWIYSVESAGNEGRYYFCSKSDIKYTEDYSLEKEMSEFRYLIIDKLWENVLAEIQNYYVELCRQLEKYGYSILTYRMTDEEFSEHCEIDDYQFLEDGKQY